MTSLEIRRECLEIASRTHHCLAPDENAVVKAAEAYFRFLTGDWTTKTLDVKKPRKRKR